MIGNNEILNYLLIKEDFLPEPTDIGDGKITIGSGLTDSKWLDLYRKRGNKWSKEDNRKAVLEEIQKRRLWAEQNVPHWNILPEPSQDALLSYRYNYNFTPKNSPKLFKALEDKNYLEAARQMDATSKNPDFKKGLLNRRKEEQQWFLSGFPELSKSNDFAIPYKYPAPEYPTVAEAYRKSMAPITDNYSQGGQLQNHKQWKDLSYSEKNDIIKVAVRNGITTLPEIRQKYNEFADEGNLYAGGGYVYDMLPQLFASDGVQVRVTSGYRPNSKVQGSGKPSRHSMHEAADIVGDFSAIRRVLDNPESNTAKWMRANGYGYLDETSKTGTKKFWHDQKGDHSHYHIGKDSGIAKKFATSTGITSNAIPIVSTGNYLDIAKAHIRNNEGWSPMPVADGPKNTGWRSVGYGFNDSGFKAKYPQGISKAYENGITKAQAEQELDYILGNMDSHLRRVYGSKWNSFNDNQKAAIIDTYYQRPASVVGRNSAFYNAVMRGDNNAVNYLGVAGYNTRNNDRRKLFSSNVTQMPETAQTVQQPLFYQPWNPQAVNLYTSYSPLTPYPAPIFSPEEQEEYFAKQIAQAQKQQEAEQREKQRQEKADRINRFSLLMSLTDPYSSDSSSSSSTSFADAVSMLAQRNPIQYFSDGGSIHIKPENRGKFTRLKERTGHSASWFKENGTPEQKKMAIFALNSKHWKHGLGGNLFDGGGKKDNNPKPVTTGGAGYIPPVLPSDFNKNVIRSLSSNIMLGLQNLGEGNKISLGNAPEEQNGGIAQRTFLTGRKLQEEEFKKYGFIKDTSGDYGLVKKAVGSHKYPIWQRTPDEISRDNLVSIGNTYEGYTGIPTNKAIIHGGSYPTAYYIDPSTFGFDFKSGKEKSPRFYAKSWDLNDYGGKDGSTAGIFGKILDFIGNPVVQTTGYIDITDSRSQEVDNMLEDYLYKKGLVKHRLNENDPYGPTFYGLPEVTVYGKKKKKALGGNLFKDGGDTKANIPVTYFTQSEAMPLLADNPNRTAVLDEVTVKPYKKLPMQSELFQGITNQAANEKADEYTDRTSLTPERFLGLMGANIPLAAGALGATVAAPALFDGTIAPLSDYITSSSIAGVPTTTWLNAGMEAGFAGHGLNHAVNEGIDGWGDAAMTAMELTPLGRLAKPVYEGIVQPGTRLFNSPLTSKWTKIGNREYRLSPNSLGANGSPLEIRAIAPRITTENTAIITPKQWTAAAQDAAYKKAVESGNRPEALRLLEQAYLRSGIPKTDITVTPDGHAVGWYHGSEWGNHIVFDSSAMNATIGGASANGKIKGNFLTTDVPSAMRYAGSDKYSSANVPEYTSPQTFSEKIKNLFRMYKPRRLYPAERVGEYAPKSERLFDTKGRSPVENLNKMDRVVYPLYVNPGENIMRLDFQGKPWSQAPVKFPNSYKLEREIHTPEKDWVNNYGDPVLEYKTETVPYKTLEEAVQAFIKDPIAKIKPENPLTSLKNQKFDSNDLTRTIEGYNSAPNYETVRLIETYTPSTTNGAVQTAAKEGKTSVLMRNVIDSNGGPNGVHYAIDDFVTLKPNQQKLADITYDDTGNLIPLSKRFNWKNPDIRYSWLPWFLGGSTTATLYNKSK